MAFLLHVCIIIHDDFALLLRVFFTEKITPLCRGHEIQKPRRPKAMMPHDATMETGKGNITKFSILAIELILATVHSNGATLNEIA
jgi:hypothetical protein